MESTFLCLNTIFSTMWDTPNSVLIIRETQMVVATFLVVILDTSWWKTCLHFLWFGMSMFLFIICSQDLTWNMLCDYAKMKRNQKRNQSPVEHSLLVIGCTLCSLFGCFVLFCFFYFMLHLWWTEFFPLLFIFLIYFGLFHFTMN